MFLLYFLLCIQDRKQRKICLEGTQTGQGSSSFPTLQKKKKWGGIGFESAYALSFLWNRPKVTKKILLYGSARFHSILLFIVQSILSISWKRNDTSLQLHEAIFCLQRHILIQLGSTCHNRHNYHCRSLGYTRVCRTAWGVQYGFWSKSIYRFFISPPITFCILYFPLGFLLLSQCPHFVPKQKVQMIIGSSWLAVCVLNGPMYYSASFLSNTKAKWHARGKGY